MADYRFSRAAEIDLDGIVTYTFENFGPQQAEKYADSLLDSAQFAANFPSIGRPYRTRKGQDIFRYNVGHHSMFYELADDGIFILRILHRMMDFDRHLDH